jgi:hypothetical protein
MFRSIAITSGADPFRIRLASSRKVPSRTPWRPFSIPQCPRASSMICFGPARSRGRLVIPNTVSDSIFSPILRSRVSRNTCAQPTQSDCRYSPSDDVTSIARFSMRPCPLSDSDARSISASRRADWRGGKAGLRLGKDSRDIRQQRRLVFLNRQNVVAPSFDDRGTNITVRKHRIASDNFALNR